MASRNRRFRTAIYEQSARIGKAISNPGRPRLLDLLCQGPRTEEAPAREAGWGPANDSQHLKALREARLAEAEKSGRCVTCRVADERVCQCHLSVRSLAEARGFAAFRLEEGVAGWQVRGFPAEAGTVEPHMARIARRGI